MVMVSYFSHIGYNQLQNEMYCVYIESNLPSPLTGSATLEVSHKETIKSIFKKFCSFDEENAELAAYNKDFKKLEWDATAESEGIKEGATLYLVSVDEPLSQSFHLTVVGISAVVTAVTLFITASILFGGTGGDIPFDYGIVIDAGSTHTEIFLYQWSGSKLQGTGEVSQKDFCRIEEGIAKRADPDGLVSCVNNVTKSLSSAITSQTKLYLGATAGMRILNITNPKEAQLILTAIKYALKTTSVLEDSVEIILGQEEGIFSWITTNFLIKTLLKNKVSSTYGALDLGGASTQIAFALNSDVVLNSSDVRVMKLYGNKFSVLSKSFLCFGLSEAYDRSKAIVFFEGINKTLHSPCLPDGYTVTLKTKDFFLNPCLKSEIIQSLIDNHTIKEIELFGSSNYTQCSDVVKKLVSEDSCQNMGFNQCLKPLHVPTKNRKFMAFSSFYYIVNYINPNGSLEEFLEASREFCSLSYQQLKEKAHNQSELSHLLTYCFGSVYIVEVLGSVYGFDNSSWKNIIFQQNIKGADVGWSLGFMINASNAIPEEAPLPPVLGLPIFILLVFVSISMISLSLMLVKRKIKYHQKQRRECLLDTMA